MSVLAWSVIALVLGTLPFSVWLGRAFLGVDVRDFGTDHNPGAGNAWRAGGWRLGLPAGLLDMAKAAVAVLLAAAAGLAGWALVPVALAPLLGHAFSPFLGFHGGKGVATTFGIWLGLTGPLGVLSLAVCFGLVYAPQRIDAWTNMIGCSLFLAGLLYIGAPSALVAVAAGNILVLSWTNRRELRVPPRRRGAVAHRGT